jgi:PAS domain S-box-containing protein
MDDEVFVPERLARLRKQAEERVAREEAEEEVLWEGDVKALVHELRVHQVELEMQNEELRASQLMVGDLQRKYFELFNFAPVGIFTVNAKGIVVEVNYTAAEMLGQPKEHILNRHFHCFVLRESQDAFYLHGREAMVSDITSLCELKMVRKDKSNFDAALVSRMEVDREGHWMRVAVFDITQRKELERQRDRYTHDLGERVKELSCMYGVARSIRERETIDEVFVDVVKLILPGWHYPEITRAKIVFDGAEYWLDRFEETPWVQRSDIVVDGRNRGTVEVYYLEERPELDEGPFMKEERNLIDGIANALSEAVEHMEAAQSLKDSEMRLTSFLENSAVIAWMKDEEGKHVFLSDNYQKRFQIDFSDWKGRTDLELWPREIAEEFRRNDLAVLKKGGPIEVIERANNPDGSTSWWLSNKFVFENGSGRRFVGGLGVDITEQRQVEQFLSIRARIAEIFLRIPDDEMYGEVLPVILETMKSRYGVFGYIDENGDFVVPSMTSHIWEKCQVPDKRYVFVRDQWGDSTWPQAIREKRTIYSNDPSTNIPDGHISISRHISLPIIYREEVIGLIQVANKETDYTEEDIQALESIAEIIAPVLDARLKTERQSEARKQAQEALAESQISLAEAQSITHIGNWDWSIDQDSLLWSDEMFRIFGLDKEEFKASYDAFINVVHPEDREFVNEQVESALEGRTPFDCQFRLLLRDGTLKDIEARGRVFRDEKGTPVRMIGTNQDITERTRAEEREKRHWAELSRIWRMNTAGEMASALAHELNQPLCAIMNFANVSLRALRSDWDGSELVHEGLEQIVGQTQRAGETIRRIRNFIESREPVRVEVDINRFVGEVVDMVGPEALAAEVELRTELAEDLPRISADPVALVEVILNLVRNAIEATSGQDIEQREVIISTENEEGAKIAVTVFDTGRGLPVEDAERMFDSFYTTKPGGLGIGLSLSRTIVESHGGKIWAEPNAEGGAVFHFTVPVVAN